jgi:hypothetical protein
MTQTKRNPRPIKTEVVETGAHENTITAVVISQIEETPDDLYRKVSDAIQSVAGTGATLSLRMTSTPLFRRPTDEEKAASK